MDDQQIDPKNQPHGELTDCKSIPATQKHSNWKKFVISLILTHLIPVVFRLLTLFVGGVYGFVLWVLFLLSAPLYYFPLALPLYYIPLALIDIVSIIFYLHKQKTIKPVRLAISFLGICLLLIYSIFILNQTITNLTGIFILSIILPSSIFAISYFLTHLILSHSIRPSGSNGEKNNAKHLIHVSE